MATKIVTKNSSTASSVPTAAQLVQGELAVNVADKRLYTEDNAGAIVELGTNPSTLTVTGEITANGGIALGDNDKATFGAGDDLQIYHDGVTSVIEETGSGDLRLKGTNIDFKSTANETYAYFQADGASTLYHNGSAKLATTDTGIDVTGSISADGLTVETGTTSKIIVSENTGSGTASIDFIATTSFPKTKIVTDIADASLTLETLGNDRLKIANNGDISFYEDTGTTAKFFWDASAESLGIGTTSPTADLEVSSASNPEISIASTAGATSNFLNFKAISHTQQIQTQLKTVDNGNFTSDLAFLFKATGTGGALSEKMRIDSAGNVGIGTSSPSYKLAIGGVYQSVNTDLISITDTATVYRGTPDGSGFEHAKILSGRDATPFTYGSFLSFYTEGKNSGTTDTSTEAMRIDSSGNLLVGKSASSFTTAGVELAQGGTAGKVQIQRSSSPLTLVNLTDEGNILNFYKGTSAVGSIGAKSGDLFIGTGDTGLSFYDYSTENAILPHNPSANAFSDALIDLGRGTSGSAYRFKDLYLSGGVYLGGTGAANKLDDYEEGTFTPAITFGGASVGLTYTAARGRYTKVGRLVTVQIGIDINNKGTSTGDMNVTGLPFGTATFSGGYGGQLGAMRVEGGWTGLTGAMIPFIDENGATLIVIRQGTSTGTNPVTDANTTSGYFFIAATYMSA